MLRISINARFESIGTINPFGSNIQRSSYKCRSPVFEPSKFTSCMRRHAPPKAEWEPRLHQSSCMQKLTYIIVSTSQHIYILTVKLYNTRAEPIRPHVQCLLWSPGNRVRDSSVRRRIYTLHKWKTIICLRFQGERLFPMIYPLSGHSTDQCHHIYIYIMT